MNTKNKQVILYDMLMPLPIIGIILIFQLIINYFWNLVIITITLTVLNKSKSLGWKTILSKNIIITIIGAIIDLASLGLFSLTQNVVLHIIIILILILALVIFNFFVGIKFFNLSKKDARTIGICMGIFTAPWIFIILDIVRFIK